MRRTIIFLLLIMAGFVRDLMSHSETAFKLLFIPGFEGLRWQIGKLKAWYVFDQASRHVPAYAEFLISQEFKAIRLKGFDPDLTVIPVMDKVNYVKKYSIEDRCIGGKLPAYGVVIDESSGTSGIPNNWVRGAQERQAIRRIVQIALRRIIGKEPFFLINAFALGPWATGMNVSMSLVDIAVLKSTGPDVKKIENTLNLFGPGYRYVIMGYPPFLKTLIDTAQVDWSKFKLLSVYGGEGISEEMRDYLSPVFSRLYGSYGASDLEINIGGENDFTIALRRLIKDNSALAKDIIPLGFQGLPMIFQYNPLDYYIESTADGELVVSLCRASNISPKIRYNIHDLGHVIRMPQLQKVLAHHTIDASILDPFYTDLPLLFHYGRADAAVAFFGCKVTPSDIEAVVLKTDLSKRVNSFSLITTEDDKVNKQLILALEFYEGQTLPDALECISLRDILFASLETINQDFREIIKMVPSASKPKLEVYGYQQGPFAINDIRLKKHYIQSRGE
jgi:phenylacetate-CoA ligase